MPSRFKITYSKSVKIALHVAFWLLLFSLPVFLRPHERNHVPVAPRRPEPLLDIFYFLRASLWIIYFYLNTYVFLLILTRKKNVPLYVLTQVATFTILICIEWWRFKDYPPPMGFEPRIMVGFNFVQYLFFLACSVMLRLFLDRIEIEKVAKERETENLKTELSFLRSQISPHFMFNVLNNMVALARKKSDLLEPSLIKLSQIMRYMIYENDDEKVLLEKEAEYLQSYIDLQQQRFGKSIAIDTQLQPIDNTYFIEPMLLIPFVENAFKHGTGMVEQGCINTELSAVNGVLHFRVRNRFNSQQIEVKDKTSGIGLENVKRRLDLLYKDRHILKIDRHDDWFDVTLTLKLS